MLDILFSAYSTYNNTDSILIHRETILIFAFGFQYIKDQSAFFAIAEVIVCVGE